MDHAPPAGAVPPIPSPAVWASVVLLAIGLLGHVYAAHGIGGSRIAYTHHIFGFFFILLVTGGVIAGLGFWLWRARRAHTLVAIALVQALLGVWIGLEPMRRAAGH